MAEVPWVVVSFVIVSLFAQRTLGIASLPGWKEKKWWPGAWTFCSLEGKVFESVGGESLDFYSWNLQKALFLLQCENFSKSPKVLWYLCFLRGPKTFRKNAFFSARLFEALKLMPRGRRMTRAKCGNPGWRIGRFVFLADPTFETKRTVKRKAGWVCFGRKTWWLMFLRPLEQSHEVPLPGLFCLCEKRKEGNKTLPKPKELSWPRNEALLFFIQSKHLKYLKHIHQNICLAMYFQEFPLQRILSSFLPKRLLWSMIWGDVLRAGPCKAQGGE